MNNIGKTFFYFSNLSSPKQYEDISVKMTYEVLQKDANKSITN